MAQYGCSCCGTSICQYADTRLWGSDETAAGRGLAASVAAMDASSADNTASSPTFARGPDYADSVPATTATNAQVTVGGSVDVNIETLGDHDWYRVTLVAGQTYTFSTSSISGSNPDTFLNLRDSTGAVISSDDDSGDSTYSLISYTPTTSGTFFIDAGTFQNESTGVYHLSVSTFPPVATDVAATTATSATLGVGNGVNGTIDAANDHDWYAISLVAGQTYIFRTGGVTATTATDTTLTLRDASGVQLVTNDDSGEATFSAIRFTATTTGTYYLDVGAFGTGTGQFNLTAFTTATPTVYTNDQIATQLTTGYWGGSTHHFNVGPGGSLSFNVQALTAPGQTLARQALLLWTDVLGVTFNEVTTGGQIVFDDNQTGAFANASYSGGITTSATVNVSTQWLTDYGTGLNSYSFQTYVHEIGHTLGLGHAGNYNGNASYAADSLYLNDSWATTVMSYFDQTENSYFQAMGFTKEFVLTPMVADGVAIASLYGTNTLTRTGNTTYGFNNTSGQALYDATQFPAISYTIFDNGGIDTLDYSGFSQNQLINLNAETFSNIGSRIGNVSIARGTVIENAIGGTGNDTIIGNAADNTIDLSRGGNDTVSGGGGNDAFIFGATLTGADSIDGGAGTNDQVGIQGNYTGANRLVLGASTLTNVELLGALPGGSYDITLDNGNVAAGGTLTVFGGNLGVGESFTVNASAELDGNVITFGGLGTDTIIGGSGADGFYFGPNKYGPSDAVSGGGGTNDQLALDGNYTLTLTNREDVEVFVMLGGPVGTPNTFNVTLADSFTPSGQVRTIFGTTVTTAIIANGAAETNGNLRMFGGSGNDTLTGGSGNDFIFGNTGADTLVGGPGADTFYYDGVNQSTGSAYDRIVGLTNGVDHIDLDRSISGVATTVASGTLNAGSFNIDLAAAIGAGQMGAGQAVLFTPTAGSLAGNTFLIADANGIAGYQADQDYVFMLPTPPPVVTVDLFV